MNRSPWNWKKTIRFLKPTLGWNDAAIAIGSAILLILIYPPFNISLLLAVALIPLFYRLQPGRFRFNAELGFLTGIVFYSGLLHWLHYVTLGGLAALIIYLSLIFSLTGVVVGWTKQFSFWLVLAAFVWAGVEYLRSLGSLSFAWGFLGHGFYLIDPMRQAAYWVGVPGLSFLVAGLNASLSAELDWFLIRFQKKNDVAIYSRNRIILQRIILLLFFSIAGFCQFYGQTVMQQIHQPNDKTRLFHVALIQGAFEQEQKESMPVEETLNVYLDLSARSLDPNPNWPRPDLIVWPESTLTMPLEYLPVELNRIQSFVNQGDVELLVGSVSGQYTEDGKWRFWNNAFLFSPGTEFDYSQEPIDLSSLPTYSKTHLVPFGEWIPLGQYWPFHYIETLIEEAGAGIFQPGKNQRIFQNRQGVRFAVTICFESTLPSLWQQANSRGVDFMINITNDAWYRRSAGLEQHLSQCCFRAAENRLYTVRAANTGISAVIDPSGKVAARIPPFESAYGVYSIPISERKLDIIKNEDKKSSKSPYCEIRYSSQSLR